MILQFCSMGEKYKTFAVDGVGKVGGWEVEEEESRKVEK